MKVTAVILAGGLSKRMGRDKADIVWNGQKLWQYQKQKLHSFGFFPIWIARNQSGFLQDEPNYKQQGPLSGIYSALKKAQNSYNPYILFLPVDMPYLSRDTLSFLTQNTKKQATYFDSEIFPLILHISVLSDLENYLIKKRSVHGFLSLLDSNRLEKRERDNFTNMNKIEDLPKENTD